jgi:parvulin-like peptidyl-prolyl isomerase
MSIIKIREQAIKKLMVPVVGLLLVAFLVSVFVGFGSSRMHERERAEREPELYVAFKLDGKPVSTEEYFRQLEQTRERLREQRQPYGATQMAELKAQLIPSLVMRELVLREAERADIGVSRRELNEEFEKLVQAQLSQYRELLFGKDAKKKTDRDLDRELKKRVQKSLRDVRREIESGIDRDALRAELMVRKFQQSVQSKVQLSDSALRDLYRTVTVRHILISTGKRPEASARRRAEEVLGKARAGQDFAKLAREFSDDPVTASSGGLLPPIQGSQTSMGGFGAPSKEVREAALRLKNPGDLSGIIKTAQGFEILKMESSKLSLPPDFEKKKEDYRKEQQRRLADETWQQVLDRLRKDAKIEFVNPEFEAYWWLAQSYNPEGDARKALEKAAAAFDRHIKANLDNSSADTSYVQLARILQMQGKTKEAAALLEKGLERFEDGYVRLDLARMYDSLGQKDKALQHYRMASEVTADWMVHMQLQQVFQNRFPDRALAEKSRQIVEREMQRQRAMQPAPPAENRQGGGEEAGGKKGGR